MSQPWEAERTVSLELARELVESQFPELAPVEVEPLGDGWDNTAVLVGGEIVFRFPRRQVAVGLLEAECGVLGRIGSRLPLPIPVPEWIGGPEERFPWPFAGYRKLRGETADRAALDRESRDRAAPSLGEFLAALHAFPAAAAREAGAPPDTWRRLDNPYRAEQIVGRLAEAVDGGAIGDPHPLEAVVEDVPLDWRPGTETLAHGDLYSRHLLVDELGRPSGVIDWGDLHVGDPAVDLAIAHAFLPPSGHDAFRRAYGEISDERWRVGRFRALQSLVNTLLYSKDVGDTALERESYAGLELLVGASCAP